MSDKEKVYNIEGIVSADDVPNWARREPKWDELVNEVMKLEAGKSLRVAFPNVKTANRARNAIRDNVNLRMAEAAAKGKIKPGDVHLVRTRITHDGDKVVAYFTMTEGDNPGQED
jgi:hypothetical protein